MNPLNEIPLISICIPVYNGAKYLRESLNSAISQSFSNIEILIIDDQSSDKSIDIIFEFMEVDSRIKFFQNKQRLGLVENWNQCVKKSNGIWIKFLFQDDILSPECISKMVAITKSEHNFKVLFCKREFIFERDLSINTYANILKRKQFFWELYPKKCVILPEETINYCTKWLGKNIFGEPPSFMIHKSVFDEYGLFDPNFKHICDLEYWLRIGVNLKMFFIQETLVKFRVHGNSTTQYNRTKKYYQMRYLDRVKLFRKFMYDNNYNPIRMEMQNWPNNLYLKTLTAISARRARLEAKKYQNSQWEYEFIDLCKQYNDILCLSKTNIVLLAVKYFLSKLSLNIKWILKN